jgi:hypothetical protein
MRFVNVLAARLKPCFRMNDISCELNALFIGTILNESSSSRVKLKGMQADS